MKRYTSNSQIRSFIAFAIAILVDEGKLQWNTPICKVLPDFKVVNEQVSKEATILDLLSHRSGITKWSVIEAHYSSIELISLSGKLLRRRLCPRRPMKTTYALSLFQSRLANSEIPLSTRMLLLQS